MATAASDDKLALYQKKRDHITKTVQANNDRLALLKDTSNLFRHRKETQNKIDVRNFNQVISIDKKALTADVEGMTTYEDLVAETLKHDLLPTVVPELKTITIGGALSGIGIESSSFRYGLVHETILATEVLLANGETVICTPTNENSDLFHALPNSYGTLGYALKITVKLIPAKKYLKIDYLHFHQANEFFDAIQQACHEKSSDYVEGVIFNQQHQVVVAAHFVDHAPFISNYKFMRIFYKAVSTKHIDYLTAKDYIWRWDSDWFWCSKVFGMQNPLIRFLLGKWMLKSKVYSKIMRFAKQNRFIQLLSSKLESPKESVIQDVAIPVNAANAYYDFFKQSIGITPIWVCPIQSYDKNKQYPLFKMDGQQLYLNFGFWGMVKSNKPQGYLNRLIEQKVTALGGNKSLYSNAYYPEDEFWQIYNKPYYMALKNKYDPSDRMRTLFQKCIEKAN